MNPIDQIADERDKLKSKLNQANAKLKQAKLQVIALAVERERALQTVDRANSANIRARAMICDAAGIAHDADILEWISRARERIEAVAKLRAELAETKAMVERLQADNDQNIADVWEGARVIGKLSNTLQRSNEYISLLENAGDSMATYAHANDAEAWREAKETKP